MASKLHVTNGDAIVPEIEAVAPDDPVLPWRDILHEGPVPGGVDDSMLRAERAAFLARHGWGDGVVLLELFERRDQKLVQGAHRGEVWLWFEDDLYDQLQLIQVLDILARNVPRDATQQLLEVSRGADREVLGERVVDDGARQAARQAWAAFRSSDPRKLISIDPPQLPDVGPAMRRLAQELPWTRDGLSRTERIALSAVADGADNPLDMFGTLQAAEERPFMGDYWAWNTLHRLGTGEHPLVVAPVPPSPEITSEFASQTYEVTDEGRDVLAARADHAELNGVDRWIGGVHLTGHRPTWRWDPVMDEVAAAAAAATPP
jgi:hypothetical protein